MENDFDINKMMSMLSNMDKKDIEKGFEKASQFLNSASSNNSNSSTNSSSNSTVSDSGIDMETIMKMKSIMEKMNKSGDDPRSKLLQSLKPYLKDTRREKVDQYIKLLGMENMIEFFNGGEAKK